MGDEIQEASSAVSRATTASFSKWVKEDFDREDFNPDHLAAVPGNAQLSDELRLWPATRKRVKTLVRQGVGVDQRRDLWLTVSGGLQFSKVSGSLYTETLQDSFGNTVREDLPCPRPFLPASGCQWWQLSAAGQAAGCRILVAIERNHPDISHCPDLQRLAAVLLHVIDDETTCFNILSALLQSDHSGAANGAVPSSHPVFLDQSQTAVIDTEACLGRLARKKAKHSYRWLQETQGASESVMATDDEMVRVMGDWLSWVFAWLPLTTVIRVVDCFLIEGKKVLYRVALAMMKLTYRNMDVSDGRRNAKRPGLPEVKRHSRSLASAVLLQCAFKIRSLSRRLIQQCQASGRTAPTLPRSRVESRAEPSDFVSAAGTTETAVVTDNKQWTRMWQWLPARYQIMRPRRVFCTEEDGYSLSTLYERCADEEPLLMLVRSTAKEVFGAFLSSSLKNRLHGTKGFSYFGSGETFLFSLLPRANCYQWSGLSGGGGGDVEKGSADYFIAGDTKCIAIGGGDGYGLWLDAGLDNGTSTRNTTFTNPPLVSSDDGSFRVAAMEVFALDGE